MIRLAVAIVAAGVALSAAQRPSDDNAFPRTKPYGRATVLYEDSQVRAVAIYEYSQRHHDQAWLLVQFGVALSKRAVVPRGSFHIIMPGGRSVPLATQQQFLADGAQIQRFRQNAAILRRDLGSYFPKSGGGNGPGDVMRWVALPGEGLVRDPVVLPAEHALAIGDLYFKSPTLRWETGVHRLIFNHEKGHAELPIRLE